MRNRIFIIDDDPNIIEIAQKLLESHQYVVRSDTNPKSGLAKIQKDPPDLLLLDINMKEMDGLEVCRNVKSHPKINHIPIIMISVNAGEADVVVGLEMGADDYIRKPFLTRELLARVKAVLRRQDATAQKSELTSGPFRLNYDSYRFWLKDKELKLSPKEFELLGFLLRHQGRVLTRSTIYEKVWGTDLKGRSRTVDSHIDLLRKKLGTYRSCITGLKGVGYRFELEEG